jgi:hypothetical protein
VTFVDAVRTNSRILAGISGPTGSGKTYSALRLATGLANGGVIAYIDTERGRALDYADLFKFRYSELEEPFTPQRYIEKLDEAEALDPTVIVVDSGSHEWAGAGGCMEMHDEIVDRIAGDDYKKRDAVSWGAWNKPKQEDRRFVNRLTRARPHVIVCLRAEEKTEMIDDPKRPGKKLVVPKRLLSGHVGWIPVAGKALPYELTLSLVMTPDKPGVPHAIKLPEPLKPFVPLDEELSEETGRRLAEWAQGSAGDPETPQRVVADPASVSPAASEPESPAVISGAQVSQLIDRFRAAGVGQRRAKDLIREVTGQPELEKIPVDRFDGVLAAVERAGTPA